MLSRCVRCNHCDVAMHALDAWLATPAKVNPLFTCRKDSECVPHRVENFVPSPRWGFSLYAEGFMNWSQCHQLLSQGDYDAGWPSHEDIVRENPQEGTLVASTFGKPIWQGETEPITLLVNAEFGDGDTIQFLRFVKLAKNKVKKVILRCNEDFKNLLTEVEVVGKEENLPEFDKIIHMMALPKVLGIKKHSITGNSYLAPNASLPPPVATQCINNMRFFKTGICWAGNPFNSRDHHRSIDKKLFDNFVESYHFFSLNNLFDPPKNFLDTRSVMRDWNETAHLVDSMNLVITVDTSIAHLAGALGTPVWLLISPDAQEWRWGQKGSKTIWYDSMVVFRKKTSWESLLEEVAEKFKELVFSWTMVRPDGFLGGSSEPGSILSP